MSADQLRQRASVLRRLAGRLDACLAIDLHRRAATDTWVGPTASRCHAELVELRRSLCEASDHLRDTARVLDQRAAQVEATG